MSSSSPSLTSRVILSVVLLIGFYALAIGTIVGLLYIVYLMFTEWRWGDIRLAIFLLIGAGIVSWSILPRRDVFVEPGPALNRAEAPDLFRVIEEVASATNQLMPVQVYLIPEMNAWVADRGGFMGFGGERVMGIGLPMLQALTVSQLRAVVAHEFGHFHGGDTKLSPWIYKTRGTIGRTVINLSKHSSILQKPFLWYGQMFLRITHSISRQQEFAADVLASNVVGSKALIDGLKNIEWNGVAFEVYQHTRVRPVLQAGFHPPLIEGFTNYIGNTAVQEFISEETGREQIDDPYDTHPTLQKRIEAVASLPRGEVQAEDPVAISLLTNVPALEEQLYNRIAELNGLKPFKPLAWEEVGEQVFVPMWRSFVKNYGSYLEGITVGSLPEVARNLGLFARKLPHEDSLLDQRALAQSLLEMTLALGLFDEGWELTVNLREDLSLEHGGVKVFPFEVVEDLKEGKMETEAWDKLCEEGKIADLDLGMLAERVKV